MQVYDTPINKIKPYENNPRKNDGAVDAVAASIKEFGWQQPIVIDKQGVIVAGHTRYKAAKKLKMASVPCVIADDLTEEQIKAFRLADNKVGELADWDIGALDFELSEITLDMSQFGFDSKKAESEDGQGDYNNEIKLPQYEIKGEIPEIGELVDTSKADELIAEIQSATIPDDIKAFLCKAATRHYVFTYKRIAEYYAHADAETQRLMEKSALVFIDYDNALANGYVKLSSILDDLIGDTHD